MLFVFLTDTDKRRLLTAAIEANFSVFDKCTVGRQTADNKAIKTIEKAKLDEVLRYKMPERGENDFEDGSRFTIFYRCTCSQL
jgi:hypothetical protein